MHPQPVEDRHPARVRGLFDAVARRYDLLNHLLSANLDRRWRREAAERLDRGQTRTLLDLCGGTGDLSLAAARAVPGALVVCCDFSEAMLERAGPKFRRATAGCDCVRVGGDGLRLPFGDSTFDAVMVGFGVRNLADLDAGLREMRRVLRPSGRLVVLEFSRPDGRLLGGLYAVYLRRVLPRIGDRISGHDGPYRYLASTIATFPTPAALARRICDAGFDACDWTTRTGGIVAIHTALRTR